MKWMTFFLMAALLAAPVNAMRAWVLEDETASDVYLVCLDRDGYRVYYDNGETTNVGENTFTVQELFTRGSNGGEINIGELMISNEEELGGDCPRYADQLE